MIKIDTDFNLNVLLNLFFSLSKKIIFSSPILANNNLPLKIYCENIAISFPIFFSFFPFFFPSFFILHARGAAFLFFPFFSPPHTYPYTFIFLLLSSFATYHFLQTQNIPALLLPLFFFFFPFFLSPFTKNIPLLLSFLSFFPLFFLYFFLVFVFPRTFHRLIELSFNHSSSSFFSPFSLSTSSVTPMQGIDFFFFFP